MGPFKDTDVSSEPSQGHRRVLTRGDSRFDLPFPRTTWAAMLRMVRDVAVTGERGIL